METNLPSLLSHLGSVCVWGWGGTGRKYEETSPGCSSRIPTKNMCSFKNDDMGSDIRKQLSAPSFPFLVSSMKLGGSLLFIQRPTEALNQYVIGYD